MLIDKTAIVLYNNVTVKETEGKKDVVVYKNRRYLEMVLDSVINFDEIIIAKEFNNLCDRYGLKGSKIEEDIRILNICRALRESRNDEALVISCNTPLISKKLIENMASINFEEDVLIVYAKGKLQPFCAIYKKTVIPYLEEMIAKNIHSIDELLNNISVRYVFPKSEESFISVDTIEEYARLGKSSLIKGNI